MFAVFRIVAAVSKISHRGVWFRTEAMISG